MTVNEKFQELFDWSGLTQEELAQLSGVSRPSISAYINCRAVISVENAYKLAKGLGVSPWTLLNCEPLPATSLDLTQKEVETVTKLRGLTLAQRELIEQNIDFMIKQNQK